MSDQLDAFLRGGRSDAASAPEPEPQPEPQERAEAQAEPSPKPEQREAPKAATAAPDEEPAEAEPDGEREAEPQHFKQLRQSVETYKREREDWKGRAIKAETERDEVRRQFEAASRSAAQPQPAPGAPSMAPPPQVDIRDAMAADPSIRAAVLTRLDTSEMLLRRELGDDEVNALQSEFTEAMQRDPTLQPRVLAQRDPYKWAHQHLKAIRLQRSIGDDPDAYRAQLRAEIEAEMLGNRTNGNGGVPQRTSPAAGMAPSLAQARSAAPRNAGGWAGPRSLDAIVGQIHKR